MRFAIRVKPGSSRPGVGGARTGLAGEELLVAVNAPAVDGKANVAVIAALAKTLGCRKADIAIISGHSARTKVVEAPDEVASALRVLLERN